MNQRSFLLRLFSLVTVLMLTGIFFTGCSKLNSANYEKIKVGMKKAEVHAILGDPKTVETGQFTLLEKTTYYYESGGAKATITFINDAVVSKDGSFK